jgi:hypothetical protein
MDNILKEAACDDGNKWYEGSMGKSKITVAPYSKLAACYLEGPDIMLRAYCQMPDNSIQEFCYDGKFLLSESIDVTDRCLSCR